jgi:hypothetical protein
MAIWKRKAIASRRRNGKEKKRQKFPEIGTMSYKKENATKQLVVCFFIH